MAVTNTYKFIHLRPIYRPSTAGCTSFQFSSSSSSSSSSSTPEHNGNSPQTNSTAPPQNSPISFSSYFSDVKAKLRQQHGNVQARPSLLSFSPTSGAPRSSFRINSREEIEKNLSEYRRLAAVPPPSPGSSAPQLPQHVSLEALYQGNVASSGQESTSAGSKFAGKKSIEGIRESLRNIKTGITKNQNEGFVKIDDKMSLSMYKESFKLKPGEQSGRNLKRVIGGTADDLQLAIFSKEMREEDGGGANANVRREFLRTYTHKDLGEKLKSLRPEKKGEWFSLQELNERLKILREIDQKGADSRDKKFQSIIDCVYSLKSGHEKEKKQMPTIDILTQLGGTPSFMLLPPQEHLIEKYFHPDNMSASEKLTLELKKVRDEFKMSESDCGSARVQVAQLTTKIKHLSTVLHKKDKHSRKGLQGMVQKRKTLLKYLRRTDWESYCFVLSKLGLRDNPDYKN